MQPVMDFMRFHAKKLAAETNIPLASLGIVGDAPSSAESIYAAEEPLIIDAEDLNDGARSSMKDVARLALSASTGKDLEDVTSDVVVNFRNPAMPSIVSQTDAMVKLASVVPGFAGTEVFWEQVGFAEDIRNRVIAETEANRAAMAVDQALMGAMR